MPAIKKTGYEHLQSGAVLILRIVAVWCIQAALPLCASNPRWTTGAPYFSVSGNPVVWYTNLPLYFTDPGDLSPYVDHASADAMVAAAAHVWNVPVSMMTLSQGGTLDEPVSGNNVYMGSNGPVFPADVSSTNYASKQIAVIYDRDGSVTELLLGGGASDPSGCRQNAVTESVDAIATNGTIQHALLILNGRCTGSAPEMQLQMQYQLERAFGRVLGLGWSQLNDNVFMGTPQPTYSQALHWPIMHPIDLVCGPYTYQCLPQPFALRDDDIASLVFLYPVTGNPVPPGKQLSLTRASNFLGGLRLPDQIEMAGVNVVLHRNSVPQQVLDDYEDVSAISGNYTQQFEGNPITPKPTGVMGSFGEITPQYDIAGFFNFVYIPIPDGQGGQDVLLHTEPVNPLYVGQYSMGSYVASTVNPTGNTIAWRANYITPFWNYYYEPPIQNAASNCSPGSDGTESAPAATPASGWWTGVICGSNPYPRQWSYAHTSWVALPVKANRTFTVEMTARDEAGLVTGNKLRPVIGVWNASDPMGSSPSVAAAATAFNAVALGMTTVNAGSTQAETFRIALTSETGDGRPDYNYQARVIYADTMAPATGTAGTQVTIMGMGFRPGNTVVVGGVTASVTSWSSTQIVATVPRLPSVAPGVTTTVDITVTDLSTQGSTTMAGAFQYVYSAPVYTLQIVSAPSGTQLVGIPTTPAFAVKVLDADGITPLAGAPVVFSAVAGSVAWAGWGSAATATVVTDANGMASIGVTPVAAGAVTLQAAAVGQTQQASFNAVPLVRTAVANPVAQYLAAGATASWAETVTLEQQGAPAQTAVTWSATSGMTIGAAQLSTSSAGQATATVQAGPLAAGAQATGSVCGWSTVCASFIAVGVDPVNYAVVVTGGGGQNLAAGTSFLPVTVQVTDGAGNPVAGASVSIHQTVRQWTPPCAEKGRCAIAPVVQQAQTTAMTDVGGNLTVSPLDVVGAEVTEMVVSAGRSGYVSLTLQRNP